MPNIEFRLVENASGAKHVQGIRHNQPLCFQLLPKVFRRHHVAVFEAMAQLVDGVLSAEVP